MSNINHYKEVKNLIHNELKITKEDIQAIIKETIQIEVQKNLNNTAFLHRVVENEISKILNSNNKSVQWTRITDLNQFIYNKVCNEVTKTIRERLEISLKEDYLNNNDEQ